MRLRKARKIGDELPKRCRTNAKSGKEEKVGDEVDMKETQCLGSDIKEEYEPDMT
jgi:hypothetical protein